MTLKIKVAAVVSFILIVLGTSVFVYCQSREEVVEETAGLSNKIEATKDENPVPTNENGNADSKDPVTAPHVDISSNMISFTEIGHDTPYDVTIKDFNEDLIFIPRKYNNSIILFNTQTRALKSFIEKSVQSVSSKIQSQAISPDGKRIGFLRVRNGNRDTYDVHVMDIEGSNERKIVETYNGRFAFSPDSESILYVGLDKNLNQIDLNGSFNTIKTVTQLDSLQNGIGRVTCVDGYVYWQVFLLDKFRIFEIWRMKWSYNGNDSVPECVYKIPNLKEKLDYDLREFKVSPNGKQMLISFHEADFSVEDAISYKLFVFNIDEAVKDNLPEVQPLFDSITSENLSHFVWSEDGEWIYAEIDGNNPGLVRFRASEPKIQMVVPDFRSNSGIVFARKKK